MACYLIAGAAGYVGSRLAFQLLYDGHDVRGLVHDADNDTVQALAAAGMRVWMGNLARAETLVGVGMGVDYVYNVTNQRVLAHNELGPTFVHGNQNLIAACSRARSVKQYIFKSSVAPYGDAGEVLVSEEHPVAPASPVGRVMVEAEQVVLDAVRQHSFPGLILRVGSIYGPERDFLDSARNHTLTIFGDGTNFVSRIHVDDLIAVLLRLPAAGQAGAIYNVADDEPMRLLDLYSVLQARLGLEPPRTYPCDVALHTGIDPSVVQMSSSSVRLSNARLKHDLGIALRYPGYQSWLNEQLAAEDTLAPQSTSVVGAH